MLNKTHLLVVFCLSLVVLAGCTFPFGSASPAVATPLLSTPQLSVITEAPLNTFPAPPATGTSTSTVTVEPPTSTVAPPTSTVALTVAPTVAVVPVTKWNLIGVGCLSTTRIEITLTVGVPATSIQTVCAGPSPCSTSSPVTYSCALVPNKEGQIYCQGLAPISGSALTACLVLPGNSQPVCNTFDNFQRYLGPCTCPVLYTTATTCGADKGCVWDSITSKCGKKP